MLKQRPQLYGSNRMLAHRPEQHVLRVEHRPPQIPQFSGSDAKSTHLLSQHVSAPHIPGLLAQPGGGGVCPIGVGGTGVGVGGTGVGVGGNGVGLGGGDHGDGDA